MSRYLEFVSREPAPNGEASAPSALPPTTSGKKVKEYQSNFDIMGELDEDFFSVSVRDTWNQLLADIQPGFLRPSDRNALLMLCKLMAPIIYGDYMPTSAQQGVVLRMMAKFGLTPADRMVIEKLETLYDFTSKKVAPPKVSPGSGRQPMRSDPW